MRDATTNGPTLSTDQHNIHTLISRHATATAHKDAAVVALSPC